MLGFQLNDIFPSEPSEIHNLLSLAGDSLLMLDIFFGRVHSKCRIIIDILIKYSTFFDRSIELGVLAPEIARLGELTRIQADLAVPCDQIQIKRVQVFAQ